MSQRWSEQFLTERARRRTVIVRVLRTHQLDPGGACSCEWPTWHYGHVADAVMAALASLCSVQETQGGLVVTASIRTMARY